MRYFETYLGDGAYAYLGEYQDVVLYTSNGIEETNRVVLEPMVMQTLLEWFERVKKAMAGPPEISTDPESAGDEPESPDPSDAQSGPSTPSTDET